MTKRQQDRAKRAAALMAAAALWQFDGWIPAALIDMEARRAALARWRGEDEASDTDKAEKDGNDGEAAN
jgi:hypothetical protein